MIELQVFIKCTNEKVKENLSLQTSSHSLQSFSQRSTSWLFGVMAVQRDCPHPLVSESFHSSRGDSQETPKGLHHTPFSFVCLCNQQNQEATINCS